MNRYQVFFTYVDMYCGPSGAFYKDLTERQIFELGEFRKKRDAFQQILMERAKAAPVTPEQSIVQWRKDLEILQSFDLDLRRKILTQDQAEALEAFEFNILDQQHSKNFLAVFGLYFPSQIGLSEAQLAELERLQKILDRDLKRLSKELSNSLQLVEQISMKKIHDCLSPEQIMLLEEKIGQKLIDPSMTEAETAFDFKPTSAMPPNDVEFEVTVGDRISELKCFFKCMQKPELIRNADFSDDQQQKINEYLKLPEIIALEKLVPGETTRSLLSEHIETAVLKATKIRDRVSREIALPHQHLVINKHVFEMFSSSLRISTFEGLMRLHASSINLNRKQKKSWWTIREQRQIAKENSIKEFEQNLNELLEKSRYDFVSSLNANQQLVIKRLMNR